MWIEIDFQWVGLNMDCATGINKHAVWHTFNKTRAVNHKTTQLIYNTSYLSKAPLKITVHKYTFRMT